MVNGLHSAATITSGFGRVLRRQIMQVRSDILTWAVSAWKQRQIGLRMSARIILSLVQHRAYCDKAAAMLRWDHRDGMLPQEKLLELSAAIPEPPHPRMPLR